MTISAAGLSLLKSCEGCRLTAYKDSGGVLTIGYGHTGSDVAPRTVWTQEQADAMLADDAARFYDGVVASTKTDGMTANMISALACLAFNIGLGAYQGSSARHLANLGVLGPIPAHIRLWDRATVDGVTSVSLGLVGRRACEVALWALPDGDDVPDWGVVREKAENFLRQVPSGSRP